VQRQGNVFELNQPMPNRLLLLLLLLLTLT
jgi:hypothetical protein